LAAIDNVREGRVVVVEIQGHLCAIQKHPCDEGHFSCKTDEWEGLQLSGAYMLNEEFSPCAITDFRIYVKI